jgi:acyl-CoA thioester hydrolase
VLSLPGFNFAWNEEIRFRDLDALAHVNNGSFLVYLESARLAWWLQVTGRPAGLQALDMMLARVEMDFRAPLFWGEAVMVGVRCASMKRSSFVMEFEVRERTSGRLCAEARKVCVYYDFGAGRSLPLPDALRAAIRAQDPAVVETV